MIRVGDDGFYALFVATQIKTIFSADSAFQRLWNSREKVVYNPQIIADMYMKEGMSFNKIHQATGLSNGSIRNAFSKCEGVVIRKIWKGSKSQEVLLDIDISI